MKTNKGITTMKNLIIATAILAATSTTALAADLGNGFSLGAELNAEYNVTADTEVEFTATPEFGYAIANFEITVETDIDLRDVDFVGFDIEATYQVTPAVELYTNVSTNDDLDFGDVYVGATFSF